jgi:subtilisin family serine protease
MKMHHRPTARTITATISLALAIAGVRPGASAAGIGLSEIDVGSPAARILIERTAPGVEINAAADAPPAAAPAAPAEEPTPEPTIGRGLMVYFRSVEGQDALKKSMGPAYSLKTFDHFRAFTTDADIPGAGIDEIAARDIAYIGEVPAPTLYDGNFVRNLNAIDTHQVDDARTKYGVNGDKIEVGVWDGGEVRISHVEFKVDRARQIDSPDALSTHATHVAGTIGANGDSALGGNKKAQGMAPKVAMRCHDWNGDTDEMRQASKDGVVCSNHSYGTIRGWHQDPRHGWMWFGYPDASPGGGAVEDGLFGRYEGQAMSFDAVVFANPGLSVFVAAGNDRNDAAPSSGSEYWVRQHPGAEWTRSKELRQADGAVRGGYDTIAGTSLSKNVITVGAINDITVDPPRPQDVKVTDFSCWGPTDDGRIKPDVVANGSLLYSPVADGDDKYEEMSGTSMATPTATGIGALLADLMKKKRSRHLRSDEMKAVLVHTAMSPNPGPSAQIGWGSIRADLAADVVGGETGTMLQGQLTAAKKAFTWRGRSKGDEPIRVTLVWIDPPGEPNTSKDLNDSGPALVHDVDLVVTNDAKPGEPHYPWTLGFERKDLTKPAESARQDRANHVDNVERVDVVKADAAAGEWSVAVAIPSLDTKQDFALVVSGLEPI